MYTVKLHNDGNALTIHGRAEKLHKGNIVKGVNSIGSFSFSLLPGSKGWNSVHDYTTLVTVYNENRKRYEFQGRVLCSNPSMDESGLIVKDVVCEDYLGFLHDSVQDYVEEQNWTVESLLSHIINTHNSRVESYKQFVIGNITATAPNDNIYIGIQRGKTWDVINEKLINKIGGEIQFRVVDGINYIDYLEEIGTTRATTIEVSKNMVSLIRDNDPSAFVTRLIPYGAKLGEDTEQRLTIESVNNGLNYIESDEAVEAYGIHYGEQIWDDITTASVLLQRGRDWLIENNKVKVKYQVKALDLFLLGLDIDDFDVHDRYPLKNHLIGVDDVARITKKTIDICDETQSTIELGDRLKTLSEIQQETEKDFILKIEQAVESVEKYVGSLTDNMKEEEVDRWAELTKSNEEFALSMSASYVTTDAFSQTTKDIENNISATADGIKLNFNTEIETIKDENGVISSNVRKLYEYIFIDQENGSITLGSGQNALTLTIDNDIIAFKNNGVQLGWWDGVDFHTGNIVIDVNERAQFGDFAFVPRSDGSLMFLKVGGN